MRLRDAKTIVPLLLVLSMTAACVVAISPAPTVQPSAPLVSPGPPVPSDILSPPTPSESPSTTAPRCTPAAAIDLTPRPSPGSTGIPAVPEDLLGKTWLTEVGARWVSGTIGGPGLVLPAAEQGFDSGDGLVVSGLIGEDCSTLFVRDLATGATVATFSRPMVIFDAIVDGRTVYWSGSIRRGDTAIDAGIEAASLGDGPLRTLLDPRPFESDRELRSLMSVSPSAKLLGSKVCSISSCDLDVIDLESGEVAHHLRDVVATDLFDDAVIAVEKTAYDTDEGPATYVAIDLASEARSWAYEVDKAGWSYRADSSTFVVSYVRGRRFEIASINVATGERRIVASLPGSPNACRLALEKLLVPELGHLVREVNR